MSCINLIYQSRGMYITLIWRIYAGAAATRQKRGARVRVVFDVSHLKNDNLLLKNDEISTEKCCFPTEQ